MKIDCLGFGTPGERTTTDRTNLRISCECQLHFTSLHSACVADTSKENIEHEHDHDNEHEHEHEHEHDSADASLSHHVITLACDNKLHLAPLKADTASGRLQVRETSGRSVVPVLSKGTSLRDVMLSTCIGNRSPHLPFN